MPPACNLTRADYADARPTRAARSFLGKVLCVQAADGYAEGMITETEAYGGAKDAASHAHLNRYTDADRDHVRPRRRGLRLLLSTASTGCSTS